MLIHRYPAGVCSVAFAPDGTLYALTIKGELWAHPADGRAKVLVARRTRSNRIEGKIDISADGRWLSVSGYANPMLFQIGQFEGELTTPNRCSLLTGWKDWSYPALQFSGRMHFTGDSSVWVGPVQTGFHSVFRRIRYGELPPNQSAEYDGFAGLNCHAITTEPGTRSVVMRGWSPIHRATGVWRGDLARPETAVVKPLGVLEKCNDLTVGPDQSFFVSVPNSVLVYFVEDGGFRLDGVLAVPEFHDTPEIALSGDGTRFVACQFLHKLVYAGRTDTGEVSGPWDWKIGDVRDVAIAPDGLTAAAAGSNKKVAVWDLE